MRVLLVSTLAFAVCFAAWMMFGVTGIPIRKELGLNASEFGLLMATPVLTGALFRLPLGIWTDRFGGRIVMFILLLGCAVPLWLSSYAVALWQFLLLGLALGLVGASFAVGTPYTSRFFPKEKKGLAMGIFGAGMTGCGHQHVRRPAVGRQLRVAERATGLCRCPVGHRGAVLVGFPPRIRGNRAARCRFASNWPFCAIRASGNIANTTRSCSADSRPSPIWMPQYFVNEYHFPIGQAALMAISFALPAGVFRALGGYLSDRFGAHNVTWWVLWVAWICLFLLSYPQTDFVIQTIRGPMTFHLGLPAWGFAMLLFILGVALACGMASTFKYISDDFPDQHGSGVRASSALRVAWAVSC